MNPLALTTENPKFSSFSILALWVVVAILVIWLAVITDKMRAKESMEGVVANLFVRFTELAPAILRISSVLTFLILAPLVSLVVTSLALPRSSSPRL